MPACQGEEVPIEILAAEPDAYWTWDEETDECVWSGEWKWVVDETTGETTIQEPASNEEGAEETDNLLLYLGGGIGLLLVVILSLFFVLRGGKTDDKTYDDGTGDFSATAAGYAGVAQMDPMEQYVQQLIAQGYPEETARAYAQQYASHFQQQQQ